MPKWGEFTNVNGLHQKYFPVHPGQFECLQSKARVTAAIAGSGGGKCFGVNTPLLMFDGSIKQVQDIVVGDQLMGYDSKPRNVLSTTKGYGNLFRISHTGKRAANYIPPFDDSYVVNEDHILSLKSCVSTYHNHYSYNKVTDSFSITVKDFLAESSRFKRAMRGWRTGVKYAYQPVRIDPYFLGVWLGDGTSSTAAVTSVDPPVINSVYQEARERNLAVIGSKVNRVRKWLDSGNTLRNDTRHHSDRRFHNTLLNDLRAYKLINNKHIPQEYLANSRRNRLQLLAGLLDTDGYFHNGCFDFTNKSKQLACDTVRLARSLGFAATLSKCRKASQHGTWGTYYRASISGDVSEIPCKLKRKQAPPRQQTKNVLHYGISVEPIGKGDYYGFEVDGDRLFLLGDYTVVHNTALGALWLMQRIQENPTGEFLQVSPTYKIFRRAAKVRWEETVQGLLDFESEYQPSYAQYKLPSGGKIYVASADNPDSFEGVQADAAWFDEAGQCNVKAWDAVKRRTNYKKSPILITTTPYLHNWLYKDVYQRWKAGDENYKVVQFPSYWNPTFDKSEFARLQSQEAQHKFSMFYKGEFARPSGLIYPELSTCVVPQPAVMPQGRLVGGADFGYNSPACFLAGVLAPDNTLWLFYERYMRKKTPTEHFPHLPKNVQWFADSAAPGEIRELRRLGTWIKPTKKFQGSVAYGISLVTRRIKAGKLQIIEGTCTNLITEGDNYRYAENEEDVYEDAPAKEQQDHACDALRYLVLGIDRKRKVDG